MIKVLMSRTKQGNLVYDKNRYYWTAPCLVCGGPTMSADIRGSFCDSHYEPLTDIVKRFYGYSKE